MKFVLKENNKIIWQTYLLDKFQTNQFITNPKYEYTLFVDGKKELKIFHKKVHLIISNDNIKYYRMSGQ